MVVGVGANCKEGVVLEMEHRRKSGRGVREWFFVPSTKSRTELGEDGSGKKREVVILLEDHSDYRSPEKEADGEASSVPLRVVVVEAIGVLTILSERRCATWFYIRAWTVRTPKTG